jgi:aspartyl-tRNA(Asn)/glutamyl-tRNA(Gln) amidotransferase subunit B
MAGSSHELTGSPIFTMQYEPVIGLEIHAQLLTASKIFCGCSAAFGGQPNTHVCPVCLGLPGALPVLNRTAVDYAIRAGLALGCTIHESSIFARKNYFYPDLPKGYQISQYEQPLATDGLVKAGSDYSLPGYDVRIKRVHMEEDAGKLIHTGLADSDRRSAVDLNRAGVPLIEIVTEPDFHGPEAPRHAAAFFAYLREVLMTIGVNDGNMEEGSLRCDANVSVRPEGSARLGTKAEIKNLNSFRFVEKALEHEIQRQIELLGEGGQVVQETRLWDADAGRTFSMRSKEEAHDYRYFPEPDLPPVVVTAARVDTVRAAMPELPAARRARLVSVYALSMKDAVTLTQAVAGLDDYFEETVAAGADLKLAKNWLLGAVLAKMNEAANEEAAVGTVAALRTRLPPAALAGLLALIADGTISGSIARDVFEKMLASGRGADEIVKAEGLTQIDDESAIRALVEGVVATYGDAAAQYRAGKTTTFGFLVGQVMKAAAGKANPKRVNELLRKALEVG